MEKLSRYLLGLAALVFLPLAGYQIFFQTPVDTFQGPVQKIFYIHVTSAWMAFLGTLLLALFSLLWLARRRPVWDGLAEAAAELALLFTTAVLVTGPLWAKPIWGVYWTWDSRLTSTFILWLILLGFFLARHLTEGGEARAKIGAVLGLLAALDLPLIHLSVLLFRTLHPQPVALDPEGVGRNLEPSMGVTLLVALVAQLTLFAGLFLARAALAADARAEPATSSRQTR